MSADASASAAPTRTDDAPVSELPSPTTCADVKKLSMAELRNLCRSVGIELSGRKTKADLFELVCQHFGISTSGDTDDATQPSAEKPSLAGLPADVREAYGKLPSFTRITSGWSVAALCSIPHFDIESVKSYLLSSPDKSFEGESLRAYKALRAYQLFDERHLHDLEANLWTGGTHFYFVRAKCWPSQDTTKSAYKCIVCIDRKEGRCFGARCRCVSGLGEACSHVAALLFALDEFCSRGMRQLQGPSVTETICRWSKPCAQKVDAQPLSKLTIQKAAPGGKKVKSWVRDGITRYGPRHPDDRTVDPVELKQLCQGLCGSIGDSGFLRLMYDHGTDCELVDPWQPAGSGADLPDEIVADDFRIIVGNEVEVVGDKMPVTVGNLVELRQKKLYDSPGLIFIEDDAVVDNAVLEESYEKVCTAEKLSVEDREVLEQNTVEQSSSDLWLSSHVGRITSSMAQKILRRKPTTPPDNLVRSILGLDGSFQRRPMSTADPRQHGLNMEAKARNAYVAYQAQQGSPVTVTQHGLFVDDQLPFLAASCDGLSCSPVNGVGVLEIKCPVTDSSIDDLVSSRRTFCLARSADGVSLKPSHVYYMQVQMQMAILKCAWADFVVFSKCGEEESIFVQRIAFDSSFWQSSLPVLKKFYQQYVVLELLTRRLKRHRKLLP